MYLICFDLDGTLCNVDHRLGFVRTNPKNWKAFSEALLGDIPNEAVLIILMNLGLKNTIIFASGRSEEHREKTNKWLKNHGIDFHDNLYMRKTGDYRSDTIVKREILDDIISDYGKKPDMVFDDRPGVVDMWREEGIFVFDCNQTRADF